MVDGLREMGEAVKLIDQLNNDFGYHPATAETGPVHEVIRSTLRRACGDVLLATGMIYDDERIPTRELSLFKTAMEEAMFWANAHVARNMSNTKEETAT